MMSSEYSMVSPKTNNILTDVIDACRPRLTFGVETPCNSEVGSELERDFMSDVPDATIISRRQKSSELALHPQLNVNRRNRSKSTCAGSSSFFSRLGKISVTDSSRGSSQKACCRSPCADEVCGSFKSGSVMVATPRSILRGRATNVGLANHEHFLGSPRGNITEIQQEVDMMKSGIENGGDEIAAPVLLQPPKEIRFGSYKPFRHSRYRQYGANSTVKLASATTENDF